MNKPEATIKREKEEAQRLVDEFLAKGGKITYDDAFAKSPPKEPAPSVVFGRKKSSE